MKKEKPEIILKVDNLIKAYGKKEVLKGVNLEIESGEIFGIIGASGSGKTTLLNSLVGFIPPTKGQVLFRNPHLLSYSEVDDDDLTFQNVFEHINDVKRSFGFAAQTPSIYGKLTLVENLDLFGSLYNLSHDARITNAKILLKLMGLYDARNMMAESLSGGMLKRLDIACSLIHDPKILILDEPTADLDPYLRKQMWHLIRRINKKGTTIILSSHFLDELEELCGRIGIIHDGTIKHYGSPSDLKERYYSGDEIHITTKYERYEVYEDKLEKEMQKLGITEIEQTGSEFMLRSRNPIPVVQALYKIAEKIEDPILDLRLNKPSFNKIFEDIINEAEALAKEQKESMASGIAVDELQDKEDKKSVSKEDKKNAKHQSKKDDLPPKAAAGEKK